MHIVEDERGNRDFDRAEEPYQVLILALHCDPQTDPAKPAARFGGERLGAAHGHAERCGKRYGAALQVGRGYRVVRTIEGDLACACGGPQLGQPETQSRQLLCRRSQPRSHLAAIFQHCLAFTVEVLQGNRDQQISRSDRGSEDARRQQLPSPTGRQVCQGGYGATSAVIVKSSARTASRRVTGAANATLRSPSPADSAPIKRAAAADLPLRFTLRCCSVTSVR